MTTFDKLALKPYLEAIEKYCATLSQTELIQHVLTIAKTVPQTERGQFLQMLLQDRNPQKIAVVEGPITHPLCEEIRRFRESVEERIRAIEESYYEENYEDRNKWYDDNEAGPEYFSEEQQQTIQQLLSQISTLFLSNQLAIAKEAFAELFKLPLNQTSLEIDLREPRARYCRCIYDTVAPNRRVIELLTAMVPEETLSVSLFEGSHPFLQDIIDARPGNLPDFDQFLLTWQQALANFKSNRAALLRLEANYLLNGLDHIAQLAREWQDQQPYGYFFWVQKLLELQNWPAIITVSQEALTVLPASELRANIAEALILAAQQLHDLPLILKGKREQCLSLPGELLLLEWINEADIQGQRAEELEMALKILVRKTRLSTLYAKACLMAGEVEEAFKLVKEEKSYGWSYSPAGVVFAGILSTSLPPEQPLPWCINNLLERYLEKNLHYPNHDSKPLAGKKLLEQVLTGLRSKEWSIVQRKEWIDWAENIGRGRIEHILNNQFRKAYERAAEVLGALVECHILMDNQEHGQALLEHYRDIQYARVSAFKNELHQIMRFSTVLSNLH